MNPRIPTERLFSAARAAAEHSYSPYSRFRVGAALLTADGTIVTGANIENRSYGLTNCAERSALFTALSAGEREFSAIAVYCPDAEYPVPPCGACRQALSEFVPGDFPVFYAGKDGAFVEKRMDELLPEDSLHELKTRTP